MANVVISNRAELDELLNLLNEIGQRGNATENENRYLLSITEIKVDNHNVTIIILPENFDKLKNLKIFKLSDFNMPVLPECIGNLANLEELEIDKHYRYRTIEELDNILCLNNSLPDSIGRLFKLRRLSIRFQNISIIPESIGNLHNLTWLNISNNKINELPESIGNLTNLAVLDISGNVMSKLPASIRNLLNLTVLNISGNKLIKLPECISQLTSLRYLDINSCYLSELPEWIGNYTSLGWMILHSNNLRMLPENLKNLIMLKHLDISANQLSVIPEYFSTFSELEMLGLANLKLDALPECLLRSGLPYNDKSTYIYRGINLHGTTLTTQPISLFFQPRELIEAYYRASKIAIKDAKVIFLGDGGAGKTHTIMRIRNGGKLEKYNTETTKGVKIFFYTNKDQNGETGIRFWDFGGQEIMHSMHRCFLTDRSCYVVVVSNRTSDLTQRAAYWLRNIESFTKGCPVLLAVNRYDNNPDVGINLTELQNNFPNLIAPPRFYSAQDSPEAEFNALTRAIMAEAEKLDSVKMSFPEDWYHIREELTRRAAEKYYISMAEYYQICKDYGGFDVADEHQKQICNWLLDWFNDMGVCFCYYRDSEYGQMLQHCQILNPEWLTNAIYIIINEGCKHAQNGILLPDTILMLLNNKSLKRENAAIPKEVGYSEAEMGYVLDIMRKFKLSYPIVGKGEFIPAICSENTPEGFRPDQYAHHTAYEMEYTYLPDTVLHRLMIVCNDKLKMQKIYRKGLQIDDEVSGVTAVVDMGMSTTTIKIDVYSKGETSLWKQLQYLRNQILAINSDLQLKAEDYIIGEKDAKRARISVSFLLNLKEQGVSEQHFSTEDNRSVLYLNIDEVLGAAFGGALLLRVADKAKENQQSMLTVMMDPRQFNALLEGQQKNARQLEEISKALQISNDLLRDLNDEQQSILIAITELTKKPEEEITQIENKMRKSKTPFEVFCGALGGVASVAQIMDFAITHKALFEQALGKLVSIASLLFAAMGLH